MLKADLHLHTNKSDGLFSPSELVATAKRYGLAAIAITDHDTVDGIDEGIDAGRAENITVVPGIEFNTQIGREELHILGYYINRNYDRLKSLVMELRAARYRRIERMVDKLNNLGLRITIEQVMDECREDASVGRPHVARALKKAGYVTDIKEAFEKHIGFDRPAFVERYKLPPDKAIDIIKSAGGVPVLAHPGLLQCKEHVFMCIEDGIQGIEVYHSRHSASDSIVFADIANRYGLIPTGGSDCHGDRDNDGNLLMGSVTVTYDTVERLIECAELNKKGDIRWTV
jgi:predicted metal-dependent phosphoesterase TrpH